MFLKKSLYTALVIGTALMSSAAIAETTEEIPGAAPFPQPEMVKSASTLKGAQKAEMEAFMREFLLENPEILIESIERYGEKQRQVKDADSKDAVIANADWLYNNPDHPVTGAKDGDITIVEFFDYNCGYCKRALSDIMTLLGEDDKVRVVFVDLPILGDASTMASRWALAAKKQDLYLEFHVALMENRGRISEATLETIAKRVGLDVEKLKADANAEDVSTQLAENITKARELKITGTPAFTIGEDLARGYVGLDALRAGVKENRAK